MFTVGTIGFFILLYIFLSWIRRLLRISNLTDKYILVTGCDSGFGKLLVRKLDVLGVNIFAACLTESGQIKLRQETSTRVKTFLLDVTKKEQVAQAVSFVSSKIPSATGLWGLVNNAGTTGTKLCPPDWNSIDDYINVFDINTLGTIRMTQALLPLLRKTGGRIVNMSSVSGRLSSPHCLPYCLSKAAIESYSDGMRIHLAQFGVSVHILEPSGFKTDQTSVENVKAKTTRGWSEASPSIKDMYGAEYFQGLMETLVNLMSHTASSDVDMVIRAYIHALTARYPRIRYSVGWDAKFAAIPLSYMPSCIQDFLTQGTFGHLTPACLQDNYSR